MRKLLYKSDDNRVLLGVCAGVADYFDLDPVAVRAFYALVTVLTGIIPGILGYICMAIIIPTRNEVKDDGKKRR